ncbi:Fructose-2,6-bisphosphatase [Zea mays]|uniref:Fructose-2,6-bisphosphatase n=1 Tax=Zea mays TaxID=4577 RepID=A0A1D6PTL2_MAIZE|nr:Fructose-2,6-bisphosphatase [Zea mays]
MRLRLTVRAPPLLSSVGWLLLHGLALQAILLKISSKFLAFVGTYLSCLGARTLGVAEPGTCAVRRSAPNSWPTLRRKEDAEKERGSAHD